MFSDADTLLAVPVNQRFEPVGDATPPVAGHRSLFPSFERGDVRQRHRGLPAPRTCSRARALLAGPPGNTTPVPGGRGPSYPWLSRRTAGTRRASSSTARCVRSGSRPGAWQKRLLVSEGESWQPIWSRNGAFITYLSTRGDGVAVLRKRADGTGVEEFLTGRAGWTELEDWSPDGQSLLFTEYTSRGDSDIWLYSGGKTTPLIATSSSEASARFSPDGRFVAFDADDGGVSHVYVQPFPGPGPRTAISAEESGAPEWINDGQQIFYRSERRMMVVDVQTHPVLRVGQARLLNERCDFGGGSSPRLTAGVFCRSLQGQWTGRSSCASSSTGSRSSSVSRRIRSADRRDGVQEAAEASPTHASETAARRAQSAGFISESSVGINSDTVG